MNKDLFFLGIQGCGKGTQGKLLLKDFSGQYDYLEMGQLFRAIMSNDNIIGNFCRDIVNSG
jgi:adenylate kinase family enzyme